MTLGWLQAYPLVPKQVLAAIDSDAALAPLWNCNFPGAKFVVHCFSDPMEGSEADSVCAASGIARGDIDVVLAGPPCQTFSSAGKRKVSAESRLVFHVCDLVDILQPKVVLIENVPQFGNVLDGRLLGRVRVRLAQAGYITAVVRLNAVHFGVPQQRIRCFVLATRADIDRLLPTDVFSVLAGRRDDDGHTEAHPELAVADAARLVTVRDAIDDLPSLAAGQGIEDGTLDSYPTSEYQEKLRDPDHRLFNHVSVRHSAQLVQKLAALKPGEAPQRLENHPLRSKEYFRNAYARLNADEPSLTVTTQTQNPGSGRFTHYRDDRVITVREAARLQSFPDSFRFFGTQEIQRRHVGNAVPPLLAQSIAEAILFKLLGR
jgi:DNA (cytosine-5)-methyltransferase 1